MLNFTFFCSYDTLFSENTQVNLWEKPARAMGDRGGNRRSAAWLEFGAITRERGKREREKCREKGEHEWRRRM